MRELYEPAPVRQQLLPPTLHSAPRKAKAYSAFCESYSLAKAASDRVCMAFALVGMSRTYDNADLADATKADYAQQGLAIAQAVYDEALAQFRSEAPPLLLPPFGAGSGPMLNTLRNKLYVGELKARPTTTQPRPKHAAPCAQLWAVAQQRGALSAPPPLLWPQSRGDLDSKLAEAQSLLTLAQDAMGKARKSAW